MVWRARRAFARASAEARRQRRRVPQRLAARDVRGVGARQRGAHRVLAASADSAGPAWPDRWARLVRPDLAVFNSEFTAARPAFPSVPGRVIHCPVAGPPALDPTCARRCAVGARRRARRRRRADGGAVRAVERARRPGASRARSFRRAPAGASGLPGRRRRAPSSARIRSRSRRSRRGARAAAAALRCSASESDVPTLMRLADIYCQPNLKGEPFGMAIAEAMRSSLPVRGLRRRAERPSCSTNRAASVPRRVTPAAVAAALQALIGDAAAAHGHGCSAAAGRAAPLDRSGEPPRGAGGRGARRAGPMTAISERLVCLTTSAAFGGAETSLLTMLTALRTLEPAWRDHGRDAADRAAASSAAAICGFDVAELPFPPALALAGRDRRDRSSPARRRDGCASPVRDSPRPSSLPRYLTALRRYAPARPRDRRAHQRPQGSRRRGADQARAGASRLAPARLRAQPPPVDASAAPAGAARRRDRRELRQRAAGRERRVRAGGAARPHLQRGRRHTFSPDGPAPAAGRAQRPASATTVWYGLAWWRRSPAGRDTRCFSTRSSGSPADSRVRAYIVGGALYETAGSQWSRGELEAKVDRARAVRTSLD